jgi:nicotinic acid phosphoribosyltransferase
VKIFCSGGMIPEWISSLIEAGADAFWVGCYISDARPIDMLMELNMVGGEPVAKRGRTTRTCVNNPPQAMRILSYHKIMLRHGCGISAGDIDYSEKAKRA